MSILKLKDSQGNWVGVPTIKGDRGNGISSAVLNNDYTLTLTFTDGTTYTTPSIRGEKGEQGEPASSMDIHICSSSEYDSETRVPTITSPDNKTFYLVPSADEVTNDMFVEWVYVNNAWEMFGSASVDLTDYVKNTDIASSTKAGVVKINSGYGIITSPNGELFINTALEPDARNGNNIAKPVTPYSQHVSTFYGLAKAAGHDEKNSELPVGQYTDEAKSSIQNMLGVPSEDEVVTDVQVNGVSVTTDGVANVPVASNSVYGLIKYSNNGYNGIVDAGGIISINPAYDTDTKGGTQGYKPITPMRQHQATFYGLAKAAGADEKNSTLAVGNYTDNAKDKIQTMLGVSPLIAPHESDPFESAHTIGELFIINGKLYRAKTALAVGEYINEGTNVEVVDTSDVYVKNTDIATANTSGIVRAEDTGTYGIRKWSSSHPLLVINKASDQNIKAGDTFGTSNYAPIVAGNQHKSVFYGLAKASGDSTQSQSDNAVGTYTNEAKASIQTMLGVDTELATKLDKPEGTVTTSVLLSDFTVTTVQEEGWNSPHVKATAKSRIPKNARYIVTYNGTDYYLPCQLWGDNNHKVVEFLGNISLYANNTNGFNQTIYDVPFCIISDLDNDSSIDVLTTNAETSTFKITKILNQTKTIDEEYLYGSADSPFKYYDNGTSTYSKLSIGNANLVTNRGGIAIGSNNKSTGDFAIATGYGTLAFGTEAFTEGYCTEASGSTSHAEGLRTVASGDSSHAEGLRTVASGMDAHAEGWSTTASGMDSHAEGGGTIANHYAQHVFGTFNIADTSTEESEDYGNYIEIVGNGGDDENRSNARTLDWSGNEKLGGSLTLGADTQDETTISASELKELKEMNSVDDVQINGTSIVTDGVANVPIAGRNSANLGVVMTHTAYGTDITNTGLIFINGADSSLVKQGSAMYRPLTPNHQHESVFYGLAKSAGDATQSASSNAVGTYTDEAKASIKNMLGVQDNMVVNVEQIDGTQNWQADKTFTEINNTIAKGINVIVDDNDLLLPYVGQLYQNNIYWFAFGISTVFNNTNVLFGYLIGDNNGQTIVTQINQNTPIPQIDDSTAGISSVWSSGKIKDELDYKVNDVTINGIGIVTDGVAEIPIASANNVGLVKILSANGVYIDGNNDLAINKATDSQIKNGSASFRPIVPANQHNATFYGLAKASGVDMSTSSNTVGTYTEEAKTAIKAMLGVHDTIDSFVEEVTGTDVTITGQPSYRYNCGEVYSLTVTPPSSGTIDFRFTSGSTPTVLTLPSTVKMPEWWVEVEANTIYEMCIIDGIYCGVMSWAV